MFCRLFLNNRFLLSSCLREESGIYAVFIDLLKPIPL
nr:MAG TPA: hypothetical protein [Caudoviricetes sp.]